jgi:hypothetical protein
MTPRVKHLCPGDIVEMNEYGLATFPRRRGMFGVVQKQNYSDDYLSGRIVKVRWMKMVTPEKLDTDFIKRVVRKIPSINVAKP